MKMPQRTYCNTVCLLWIGGVIRDGLKEPEPTSGLQIGYPVVIAIIYALFGHSARNIFYFQFILSILDLLLMYGIMQCCRCKRGYVVLVLTLAACYPGFIYNINKMLTEQLFKTLLLLLAYFTSVALNSCHKIKWYVFSAFACGASVFVRGLAFPFVLLITIIILLFENDNKIKLTLTFGFSFLLTQVWWWIRNLVVFHRFILLTDASEGPKIWGLMPYYMDMASSNGHTAQELLDLDKMINFPIFIRWKIFGQINYLWYDIWDEQQVHSEFRWCLWIQILLILIGILLPVLVKRCNAHIILVTSFPMAFTFLYLPYHGLPRYLYPSISFLFISFAMLMSRNNCISCETNEEKILYLLRYWCNKIYFFVSIIFSVLLFISIFIFSPFIRTEMSEWRLNKYANTSIGEINEREYVWQKDYGYNEVIIENSINMQNGLYVNDNANTSIIKLDCESINRDCVTKVDIDIRGGYFYDYFVVYWQDSSMTDMDGNHYYMFPTNNISRDHFILYIDGDVTALQIVPYTFRGGKFEYKNIRVSKMLSGKR